MNYSTYRFTLDIHSVKSQVSIPAMFQDTWTKLYINLTDGGKPYKLEDGCTAKFFGKKADGTALVQDCEISEDRARIIYTFSEQTASTLGTVNCELRLYSKTGLHLTSPTFLIVVESRVIEDDDIIESDADLSAIDNLFATEGARVEAEEARAEAEQARIEAEEARENAETERVSAEEERGSAETERVSAEEERASSEAERIAAEEGRISAEEARVASEVARVSAEEERISAEAERASKDGERTELVNRAVSVSEGANETATQAKVTANRAEATANSAKQQSDMDRLTLVNISAQVQGIDRSYVVDTFLEFIDFLNGRASIPLREDRDGDGVEETYSIYVYDLKTVDNIIIVEDNVPDFWIEKNSALSDLGSYTYNGTTYSLGITVDGSIWGRARINETDITVIEGHAISAAVSASNAAESEKNAKEAEASVETMVDELFFNQIAPPYGELENSVFLATPTYDML